MTARALSVVFVVSAWIGGCENAPTEPSCTYSGAQGTGNGTVAYQVAVNAAAASRSASISVADQTHAVSQTGTAACSYALDADHETFPASGGTDSITVSATAGCPWTAHSNAGWIRVTAPAGGQGTGDQVVSYAVDPNTGDDGRTGTMTVADKTFVVTQAGARVCECSVLPVAVSPCMAAWEGTVDVSTQTACSWTASTTDAWITLLSGQAGSGSGTIRFRVANNDEAPPREGIIKVRWPTPTEGQNVRVSQGGCSYIASPASLFISAAGGDGFFDVFTMPTPVECGGPLQDRCVWTVRSNASWITITSSASTTGDGQVRFTVAPYAATGPLERIGTITAGGKTVYVYQRP